MTTMFDTTSRGLLVGGEWVDGELGDRIEVIDPVTEEPFASVADATVRDGLTAVDAAWNALRGWEARAPRERAEVLRRSFELMTERAEDLAELITRENGKALPDARAEVACAAELLRWYSEETPRVVGSVGTAPVTSRSSSSPAGRGERVGEWWNYPGRHGDPQDRPCARPPDARSSSNRRH